MWLCAVWLCTSCASICMAVWLCAQCVCVCVCVCVIAVRLPREYVAAWLYSCVDVQLRAVLLCNSYGAAVSLCRCVAVTVASV